MSVKAKAPRIIVALDFPTIEQARELVAQLNPNLCRFKIASTMFTRYGPAFIEELVRKGFAIFLDLKYYDIPKQVAGACRSAAELGVWMVDLHVQGGHRMIEAAVNEMTKYPSAQRPLLVGVTILTSMDNQDLKALNVQSDVKTLVPQMAQIAKDSGLDGVVCSAQEAVILRQQIGEDFVLVTPGIRLASDDKADQRRVMTPEAAFAAGADYLVIGRSITQAEDPVQVLESIAK